MKKTIILVLVVFAVIFTFSSCIFRPDNKPDEVEEVYSENLYYQLSDDGESYWVMGIGDCTDKDIIIPSKYNGKPVIGVGEYAFSPNDSIESITLPDSVRSIGDHAFYCCINLRNLTLGKSVERIGDYAIDGSIDLKISVSSENKHYKLIDGHLCSIDGKELIRYSYKKGDTSITVPNSIERIANNSFSTLLSRSNSSMFTFNEYMNAK